MSISAKKTITTGFRRFREQFLAETQLRKR